MVLGQEPSITGKQYMAQSTTMRNEGHTLASMTVSTAPGCHSEAGLKAPMLGSGTLPMKTNVFPFPVSQEIVG